MAHREQRPLIWHPSTLESLLCFELVGERTGLVAFFPDGQRLLALVGRSLAVWPWRELAGLV